jgi:predicted O-methyltransferase YrrM
VLGLLNDESDMSEHWKQVDAYVEDLLVDRDEALVNALRASEAAQLPSINVTPAQGKLLHLLARSIGARRILEVGTLGGYSTIWLARALTPGGVLVTIEADVRHAEIARSNIARAGLSGVVSDRTGRALDVLPQLEDERAGPFDLTFIDADKPNTSEYFACALRLSRPGSLIIADNVVRDGAVADPSTEDASVQGMRRLMASIAAEPRVSATVVQTVGAKGYDGFALALVTA